MDIGSGTPNPFVSSTAFAYRLESPARVRAVVLDLQGRMVDVLEDTERGPGDHEFEWDDRDAGGGLAPPGLYFVRARIAGNSDRF